MEIMLRKVESCRTKRECMQKKNEHKIWRLQIQLGRWRSVYMIAWFYRKLINYIFYLKNNNKINNYYKERNKLHWCNNY